MKGILLAKIKPSHPLFVGVNSPILLALLRSGLLLVLIFLWGSCTPAGTQMDFQKLPPQGWPLGTPVRFDLKVADSLQPQSIWLTLRHSNDYPFSNIYLITTLSHPNGAVITDTLSYDLAAADGQWLGSGNGIVTHKLPFKKKVRFETSKPYRLSVYHSVRALGQQNGMAVLPGITEVGYELAPSQE